MMCKNLVTCQTNADTSRQKDSGMHISHTRTTASCCRPCEYYCSTLFLYISFWTVTIAFIPFLDNSVIFRGLACLDVCKRDTPAGASSCTLSVCVQVYECGTYQLFLMADSLKHMRKSCPPPVFLRFFRIPLTAVRDLNRLAACSRGVAGSEAIGGGAAARPP